MMWLRKYAGWLLGGVLGMLLCAACNPHEFPVSPEGDPGRDFSVRLQFADDMPVLRTVSGDTKAAGGANAWRYSVQLLRYRDDISFNLTPDYAYTFTRSERISALDTTVYLPIDPARYRLVAWVDRLDADGVPGYDISDFEYISVGEGYDLGKGTRDAFRGVKDLDLEGLVTAGEVVQETLKMTRPVARLRFIAPEALTFLSNTGADPADMTAALKYTAALPEGYNLLRDKTMGTFKDASVASIPQMNTDGELEFCTDYVFAADEEGKVSVSFSVTNAKGTVLCTYTGDLPVRRGYTTTVTFTGSGGGGGSSDKSGGIGISPGFDSEIEVPINLEQ